MNAPNELSFLPEDYLEQKWKRRANVLCVLLLALAAGGIGFAYWTTTRHDRQIEQRYSEVDVRYTDAARRIEQAKKMHEQQRQVIMHAQIAAGLVEKVPRSNMLAEITNSLPAGVSLLDLAMTSKPHADNSSAPSGQSSFEQHRAALEAQHKSDSGPATLAASAPQFDIQLKATGVATTDVQVAQLITRLNHSRIFQDVNLVISDAFQKDGENLRKFQLEMSVNPQAEVRDENKTKTAALELNK